MHEDVARPRAVLVRSPAGDLARAELTFRRRTPVDVAAARRQHAGLVAALADLGLAVVHAPPLDQHPDAVFVEDAVVVVDDLAVLTRPGAPSRRGERDSLRPLLTERGLTVVDLPGPGRLDGGDVLQLDDLVLVGRSTRTDDEGISALAAALAPRGRRVEPVDVDGALHLKTAVTVLPDGALVVWPGAVGEAELSDRTGREIVVADEPSGANVLAVGPTAVLSSSAPGTARTLAGRGLNPVTVDLDELERLEAGPTCCCVLLPR